MRLKELYINDKESYIWENYFQIYDFLYMRESFLIYWKVCYIIKSRRILYETIYIYDVKTRCFCGW